MKIQTTTSEPGQSHDKGYKCKELVKAINFHAGRCIPFVYKDGCDMPNTFVNKVKEALNVKAMMRDVEEDYITNLVKSAWAEWTSLPSATLHSQRKFPFVDSLDENVFDKLHDDLFDQWRELLTGNEWGEPYTDQDFIKTVKFHTRRHVPITYKDSRDIPDAHIQKVIAAVTVYFVLTEVDEDHISDMIKDAWRGIKNELRRKYIKNKDPATVKASPPSPFVSKEDWSQFVDMYMPTADQNACPQNAANQRKGQIQFSQETAKERYLNCDVDLEITERTHNTSKKRKALKDLQEKNQETASSDPLFSKRRANHTRSEGQAAC